MVVCSKIDRIFLGNVYTNLIAKTFVVVFICDILGSYCRWFWVESFDLINIFSVKFSVSNYMVSNLILHRYQALSVASKTTQSVLYNRAKRTIYVRYYINGSLNEDTIIAECIDPANTSSTWNEDKRALTFKVTAKVGDYVLWRPGTWADSASRIYKVVPRPLS